MLLPRPRDGAAQTVDGARASAGPAGTQNTGQSGACGAHRGIVGEQFDEQPHRVQRAGAADEAGEGGVHRSEHFEHQVVTGPQVRPLVAQDRGDLGGREGLQRSLADHHAAANTRKAIGERLFDIEDAQIVHVRAVLHGHPVGRLPEQVDQHPVVRRRRRVTIATCSTAITSRAPTTRVSAHTAT